jgi:hypothetical protein
MVPCVDYVILVWFVDSCYPGPASLTHLHGFDEVRMHQYGHLLHWKVLKTFMYIYGRDIQSERVLGLTHVIVVRFVPSCYPGSARSTHLHGFDEVRMHPYGHSLHQKVLNHFIHIYNISFIQSEVVPDLLLEIVVRFVPSCYPNSSSSTHLYGFDGLRIHQYGHPLHWKVVKNFIYI